MNYKIFILIPLLMLLGAGAAQAAIPTSERDALVALYNETNGASWSLNDDWLNPTVDACDWYGVVCDGGETTVLRLALLANNLSGNLPAELGDLTNLQMLLLSNNQLTGNIPAELGNLASLQMLLLSSNQLTGTVPAQLGNLMNLENLDLYSNQLGGALPSQLGNLSKLQWLRAYGNQFTGSIPASLGNLASLNVLLLYDNKLSGSIPSGLGNLSNLTHLDLAGNRLNGFIPAQLGNLGSLRELSLSRNQLSGPIPSQLGDLGNLQYLYLDNNKLNGSIPASFMQLISLANSGSDISYNALYTANPVLDIFLDGKQWGGDWSATQTVAPTNITTANRTANSVDLLWSTIEYTADSGGYHIYYGTTWGGPYLHTAGPTANKSVSQRTVSGLSPPPQQYCFVLRTRTDPHGMQQNTVWSDDSAQSCLLACDSDDADCDGLPNAVDRDECVDTAMTIVTDEQYDGIGNTRLSSAVRIDTEADGTIAVLAPHLLILKAPEVVIRTGVTFWVERGARLLIYSQPDPCQ